MITMEIRNHTWQLCSTCWRECLDRAPLGNIPKRYRENGYEEPT